MLNINIFHHFQKQYDPKNTTTLHEKQDTCKCHHVGEWSIRTGLHLQDLFLDRNSMHSSPQFVYSFSSLKFHCHTFLYIIDTFLIMFQKYDLLLKQLIVILSKNSSEERVDYSAQVQDSYSSSSISMNRSIEISMNLSIPSDRCDASFGFLALNLKKKMKNFYSLLPFSLQMDV